MTVREELSAAVEFLARWTRRSVSPVEVRLKSILKGAGERDDWKQRSHRQPQEKVSEVC